MPDQPVIESLDFESIVLPKVISLKATAKAPRVRSFSFSPASASILKPTVSRQTSRPASKSTFDQSAIDESNTSELKTGKKRPRRKLSRCRPPQDVIKLQDRLFFLLQPPLETLVDRGEIDFPFEPFPYQFEGIAFLYPRHTAILADEMGLGKTMQAITTIRLLVRSGQVKSVLLICPKPLVANWQREFKLWAPEIGVSVVDGKQSLRRFQWRQNSVPVTIANYELVCRDRDVVNSEDFSTDMVVLDEAQRIKNKSSATSEIVRGIRRTRSWALTGTPIENSSEDIVGIFEFLHRGLINSDMSPQTIASEVSDFIVRRTKDEVLTDMPPRLIRDAEIGLTAEQAQRYDQAENDGVVKLNDLGSSITIQHVFELVLRLKQICNFDPLTGASSKMERLEADLEEIAASGQKAIVFSQWVKSLDEMQQRLERFNPLAYHGQIPHQRREPILKQFKEDPDKHVILMSYGAGSVGLNLQFCRYVFLFDRWWNPAVEDQAINRAHRIGATGSVTVTRMLVAGTIEERINQVLEQKRELFDTVLSKTGQPNSAGLSRSEIFNLFNLKPPSKSAA